jgi:hypothetical protein
LTRPRAITLHGAPPAQSALFPDSVTAPAGIAWAGAAARRASPQSRSRIRVRMVRTLAAARGASIGEIPDRSRYVPGVPSRVRMLGVLLLPTWGEDGYASGSW